MRPFSETSPIYSSTPSPNVLENAGDESLVFDRRGRMRPAEVVERKFQNALQNGRAQFDSPFKRSF